MELRWRHCIINSRCSWLPGDLRGFRSRDHRIHSSGHYKHRPPAQEHARLRQYIASTSAEPISFEAELKFLILAAFLEKLRELDLRVIAASIGDQHLHALARLPFDLKLIRRLIGQCKQRASPAVRDHLPGTICSAGGEYKWVKDRGHLHNVYQYIRTKQERGTVVWSHRDDENWMDRNVPVKVMR